MTTMGGGKVALFNKWDARKALATIKRFALTTSGGVPFMVQELTAAAKIDGPAPTLTSLIYGGAPASDRVASDAVEQHRAAMCSQACPSARLVRRSDVRRRPDRDQLVRFPAFLLKLRRAAFASAMQARTTCDARLCA